MPRAAFVLLLALLLAACGGGGMEVAGRLVIVRADGLYERSLQTGDETLLIANGEDALLLDPAPEPGRTRLAYVRQLTGVVLPGEAPDFGSDLYLAERDGRNIGPVYEHSTRGELVRWPRWLPDGDLLAGVQRFEEGRLVAQVIRIDTETEAAEVLVDGALQPAPSPDGRRLVYVRVEQDFSQSLWLANIDGSGARMIAGPEDGIGTFDSPRFSPDGRLIAFGGAEPPVAGVSRAAAARSNGLPADVWLFDLDANEVRGLADLDLDSPSLAWSADGARLFVFSGTGLFAIDLESGDTARLADGTFHGQMDWLGLR
jgi:Tol biopolymer transport system component